ncbi:MAG: response regulator [Armatimonadetes bacterium]|nr:response regulator [Armatimonadota bacterium]
MKILLAEDSVLSRERETRILQSLGHNVIPAKDGEEAIRRFETEKPNAVITDLEMPGMNGLEVIRSVRQHSSSVPVLVCTSSSNARLILNALSAGANEVIPKPMDFERVQKILAKFTPASPKG